MMKYMKRIVFLISGLLLMSSIWAKKPVAKPEVWPDGSAIDAWFLDTTRVDVASLGKQYKLTDYGIFADGTLHTAAIQALIDRIAAEGGGVLVVPAGTFETGALFFKQGVHLHLMEGGVLLGSDNIADYPLKKTRIEGETCLYFTALVNAEHLDGFTITGKGTIDGNGLKYHQAFWLRRQWNPQCTNKDEQRPRLVYISDCSNVRIEGVRLQHSAFWTTHIYRSNHVKIQGVSIYSLAEPATQKGPSTDAIDLDVVEDIVVRRCYMSVNDDAIAMKGGKGPWADDPTKSEGNGANQRILIEDCVYGFCHGCLTCGSESVHNRNILMRRIQVDKAERLLWLKMRPDTPQLYEYITVEDISGNVHYGLYIKPWTQFYDLKDRKDIPMSYADHVTMRRLNLDCEKEQEVSEKPEQYILTNFVFEK